jgi:hypothetical protein
VRALIERLRLTDRATFVARATLAEEWCSARQGAP